MKSYEDSIKDKQYVDIWSHICWKTGKEEIIEVCELRKKSVKKSLKRGNIPEYYFCADCGKGKNKPIAIIENSSRSLNDLICQKCNKIFRHVNIGIKFCENCRNKMRKHYQEKYG